MKKYLILFLILTLACCKNNAQNNQTEPDNPEGYVSVPLSSAVTNVQPMTGIVIWADNGSARTKPWVTMEFAYMLYNTVCKEKDVYDWTPVDKLLASIASRGHQAVIRFRYTYVGEDCAVPDYIKARDDYEVTWGTPEGEDTEFPDWRCEELRRFHMEFHKRFAERYDNDPRLAFLETGFGLWAEYHIYEGPFILGQTFPSKAFQSEFLKAMDGWFVNTPWCISIDAAQEEYAPFHEDASLLNLNFGNFDDSFMCEEYDKYNAKNWEFFGTERYKRAPLGGEFSYYSKYDQQHCLDKGGMYGRTFENQVAKYHMTFIIGNDQPGKQTDARIQEAAMSMGYRFEVRNFSVKTGAGASVRIANTGVAPIYRDAFLAVDGIRSGQSLRTLMPGTETTILIDNPAVTKNSKLTIECDALLPGKTLPFDAVKK